MLRVKKARGERGEMYEEAYWVFFKVETVQEARDRDPHVHLSNFPAHAYTATWENMLEHTT
jgi:hypothetical protein